MATFIYSLDDPITGMPRYVGKTTYSLSKRLSAHISDCKKRRSYSQRWTYSLLKSGLKPAIELIDIVPTNEWEFWEKFYISLFRSWGFKLVNYTDGGNGILGYKHTKSAKLKMSKNNARYWKFHKQSPEHRSKVDSALRGIKLSDAQKEQRRQSMIGRKITWADKISRALTGKKLSESRCLKLRGKKRTDEQKQRIRDSLKHKRKPILQFDLRGNLIKEWDSIVGCSKQTGYNSKCISAACLGKLKTFKEYIWKHKN